MSKQVFDFTRCGCPAGITETPAEKPPVFQGVNVVAFQRVAVVSKPVPAEGTVPLEAMVEPVVVKEMRDS